MLLKSLEYGIEKEESDIILFSLGAFVNLLKTSQLQKKFVEEKDRWRWEKMKNQEI